MVSAVGRQSLRMAGSLWRARWICVLLAALVLGGGCKSRKRPGRPVNVIYINRRAPLGPQEQQILALARAEVDKWDVGLEVADHRVQPNLNGWTVSLLLRSGFDDDGKPIFATQPIRNVEINRAMEVIGYHVSQ